MLARYEDIGYKFEKITELVELLNENKDEAIYYDSVDGTLECMVIEPDCATRFWYYKRKDEDFISAIDLHYTGETSFWVRNPNWTASRTEPKVRDSFGKQVPVKDKARPLVVMSQKGATLCVNIVDAPMVPDFSTTSKLKLAVTAFAEEARVIPAEIEETFVPLGMFSAEGEADVPRATMTAVVREAVLQYNSYTGSFFHEIDVECLGMEFTIVGNAAAIKGIPKPGNRITGNYWLSGTIKEILRK